MSAPSNVPVASTPASNVSSTPVNKEATFVQTVYDQAHEMFKAFDGDDTGFRNVQTNKFYMAFNYATIIEAGRKSCESLHQERPKAGKYEYERYPDTQEKIQNYLTSKFVMPNDPGFNELNDMNKQFFLNSIKEKMADIILENSEPAFCPDVLNK